MLNFFARRCSTPLLDFSPKLSYFKSMNRCKLRDMKRLVLVVTLILTCMFIAPVQASAQQICFSEFPDSAWNNGEPVQVKSKLNFNLVGKKTSNVPLFALSNLTYEGITFVTTYEYSGTDCSTRIVKVSGSNNGIGVIYKSVEEWKANIRKSAKDFQAEKTSLDTVDRVVTKLNETIINIAVTGKIGNYQTGPNVVPSEIPDVLTLTGTLREIQYINDQPYRSPVNNYLTLLQSRGDCVFYPTVASSYDGLRDGIKVVGISGRFASRFKFATLNDCKIKVLLASPSTWGGGLDDLKTGSTGFIELGELIFRPIPNEPAKKTIFCVKGKLTKKVSGVNPKCSAGYKKSN